jgi:hypothetical protein
MLLLRKLSLGGNSVRNTLTALLMITVMSASGQAQLKQFGTKLFDESGRSIKLEKAISLAKTKSEKAYIAFQLADYIKSDRANSVQWGILFGLWAVIPSGRYYEYTWYNAVTAGVSISQFALMTRKSELEEALRVGVEAYNAAQ